MKSWLPWLAVVALSGAYASADCAEPDSVEREVRLPLREPALAGPELEFKVLKEHPDFAAACFPGQGGAKIGMREIEYQEVYDPALKAKVHLRAYVFRPPTKAAGKLPVVAMFHGGGWREGSPAMWFPQALYLASRGAVAVSFQYRVETVHGPTSDPNIVARALADARTATRWLKANAARLGIDPERAAFAGDSSGGHLALLAGYGAGAAIVPKAIVPVYPVVTTRQMLLEGPGKPIRDFPDVSPIDLLDSRYPLPPTRIIQGARDILPTTPPKTALAFCRKADLLAGKGWSKTDPRSNAPCQADLFAEPPLGPGKQPHYFHGFMEAPEQYKDLMRSMDQFLTERKLLSGDPAQAAERVASAGSQCISTVEHVDGRARDLGYANGGGLC